jgi:hypothetical protein
MSFTSDIHSIIEKALKCIVNGCGSMGLNADGVTKSAAQDQEHKIETLEEFMA